jgi:protocatechuate 3,4-dioxygenase beta subunit
VPPGGQVTLMHGVIRDMVTGKPLPGAVFDIWQASANGKYDFQDPENQSPNNLRGKFRANEEGKYWFYCLHPTAYSLPRDGPNFQLLQMLDRHSMRPAHIHIMVGSRFTQLMNCIRCFHRGADTGNRSRRTVIRDAPRNYIRRTTHGWRPTQSSP